MESNGTFLACNSKSVQMSLHFSSLILSKSFVFLLSSPSFASPFSHLEVMQHLISVTERDDRFFSVDRVSCVGRKGVLAG